MIQISVSPALRQACPHFALAAIECEIQNSSFNSEIWQMLEETTENLRNNTSLDQVNKLPNIAETRLAYKKLGKDPNRYRPSAEALCRRIVKGMPLYQIDTAVDLINLVSIRTGYSIGGFDADKIEGKLSLGVGEADESFEAIGRGLLNIEGLPVYRDEIGAIGTPTSDEVRTRITASTSRLLLILNGYSGRDGLNGATEMAKSLLEIHTKATGLTVCFIDN